MSLILIVEDNENNLELLRDVLRFKGYETIEATTGTEGVRLALERKPALVLMDIQLEDISGIEALAQIRANPATTDMPVVAVSASVMPEDQQKIVASGFNAYVRKPINVKSFMEVVEGFAGKPEAG